MQDLTISLIQADLFWEDPDRNLSKFDRILGNIDPNSDLVVLPEMFNTGFTMNVQKCAETEKGKSIIWLRNKAKELNCVISGSLLIEEKNKFYNRLFWMRPDGSFEFYNKRHLFRMSNEHLTMTGGKEIKIVGLKGWKINLQVCYDLRFPVWSKNALTDGIHAYDILLYVANWPEIRKQAYEKLLHARAIENQAYVVWVNRVGKDGNNIVHSGDSSVIDPYGNVLKKALPMKEEILTAKLSWEVLSDFRKKFQVGLDWDDFRIE
ncbi:MAG: amidohydrolase [Bacteroidales bacterium]